jgi:hypothetical protein
MDLNVTLLPDMEGGHCRIPTNEQYLVSVWDRTVRIWDGGGHPGSWGLQRRWEGGHSGVPTHEQHLVHLWGWSECIWYGGRYPGVDNVETKKPPRHVHYLGGFFVSMKFGYFILSLYIIYILSIKHNLTQTAYNKKNSCFRVYSSNFPFMSV